MSKMKKAVCCTIHFYLTFLCWSINCSTEEWFANCNKTGVYSTYIPLNRFCKLIVPLATKLTCLEHIFFPPSVTNEMVYNLENKMPGGVNGTVPRKQKARGAFVTDQRQLASISSQLTNYSSLPQHCSLSVTKRLSGDQACSVWQITEVKRCRKAKSCKTKFLKLRDPQHN